MPIYPPVLRALVLDGDSRFVESLRKFAAPMSWDLDCRRVTVSLRCLRRAKADLLLFDPVTTGAGGWTYLTQLYELTDLSLVVCTRPVSREQRVCGLRRGVDAWLTKPLHPLEVLARIEAVARGRCWGLEPIAEPLALGNVLICPDRKVFVDGGRVPMTRSEFAVLAELAAAEGRVLPREEIYRRVWGYSMQKGDRSVDAVVKRLRCKLRAASATCTYIHTHNGIGYRFDPQSSAEPVDEPKSQDRRPGAVEV